MAKKVGDEKEKTEASPQISAIQSPRVEVGEIITVTEPKKGDEPNPVQSLSAQDILEKSPKELEQLGVGKREAHNLAQTFRIITAILLGKNKNKDLAQALNTDKSFASKQVKELEEQGLVKKEEDGREVKYVVDPFNVMKFLQSKVVIKIKDRAGQQPPQDAAGTEEKDGRTETE
jgi:predicted transcriptional regulator